MKINLYKRSDGVPFAAEEGSASDKLMARDGSFELQRDLDVDPAELAEMQKSRNEGNAKTKQSGSADGQSEKTLGSGGPAKRGGARGKNKEKDAPVDAQGSSEGKDLPPVTDNKEGEQESAGGTEETQGQPE